MSQSEYKCVVLSILIAPIRILAMIGCDFTKIDFALQFIALGNRVQASDRSTEDELTHKQRRQEISHPKSMVKKLAEWKGQSEGLGGA